MMGAVASSLSTETMPPEVADPGNSRFMSRDVSPSPHPTESLGVPSTRPWDIGDWTSLIHRRTGPMLRLG